ncbi:methyl-accepting chemotaxis protein [Rhodoplanes sp. Z2-YC6860]|uniref:methyl-accepting chemotaxis protein n=1 Tax=Rhodoplanes sp. Z2-YC6860 TaxID=674703 RepID=UPI00078D3492|nr:methyl-accepting chemotaxis protein [Rhodoplanes sp. Z2-YC6860]AMN39613.1 methyl-accepting chemotaxis protein [Rhodoplanes sp. Z2-YC6860]
MKFSNVKTLYKILLCFAVLTVFIAGATWFATGKMRLIDDTYTVLLERESIAMKEGVRVQSSLQNFARLVWRLVSETEPKALKENDDEVARNRVRMAEFAQNIAKLSPSNGPLFAEILRGYEKVYQEDYLAIKAAKAAGKNDEALRLVRDLSSKNAALRTQAAAATDALEKYVMKASADATEQTNSTIATTVTVISGALAAAIALAFLIAQFTIVKPLRALTGAMHELANGKFEVVLPGLGQKDEVGEIAGAVEGFKVKAAEKAQLEADETLRRQKAEAEAEAEAQAKIATDRAKAAEEQARKAEEQAQAFNALADGLTRLAKGDLSFQLNRGFTDEYKQIRDDFNGAIAQLKETIGAISASTSEVASAASEIATATTDLSQRTEEQAASLEETSASMEQISATVKKNAENAQHANQSASATREVANRGGEVVSHAITAMSRIDESSKQISDIISVIDEIARQTNLLALNAAVEAARAGDAGRGFAVVAAEVRTLAQRSSQAAKDIKDLITTSNSQVKDGVDLVNRAGQSLKEIVDSIESVANVVSDIANASSEQAGGIDQVNKALSQMDQVTQQNSALVEQNAATAKNLQQQSAAMSQSVGMFKLHGGSEPTPVVKPAGTAKLNGSGRGGPARRMQAGLATAFKAQEFEEF